MDDRSVCFAVGVVAVGENSVFGFFVAAFSRRHDEHDEHEAIWG
jgi:hypothetical protein